MTEKQFEDFLQKCYKDINEKQKILNEKYHLNTFTRYTFNQQTRGLQLRKDADEIIEFEVACIGSWAPKDQVWIWAWANDNFSEVIREEGAKLKELGNLTGHEVFTREGFECEEVVTRDLAYMSAYQLGAIGLYRIEAEDSYVFLALKKIKKA